MTGSSPEPAFPEPLVQACGNVLGIADSRVLARLRGYLGGFPESVEIYRRKGRLSRPARIRDQLDGIVKYCDRMLNGRNSGHIAGLLTRIGKLDDQSRNLLRYAVADHVFPGYAERILQTEHAMALIGEFAIIYPATLRDAAARERDQIAERIVPGSGGRRHRSDWAMETVLLLLASYFFEFTGRKPQFFIDRATDQPSGQFVEFAMICLQEVGFRQTPAGIREYWRRLAESRYRDHLVDSAEYATLF